MLLVATCVLALPSYLVSQDIGKAPDSDFTDEKRLQAINSVRGTLIQGIGGALVLVGIFFTWQQLRVSWQQLRVDKEGEITDRFTKAVEQLGHLSPDVRVGGVYALERMARDSEVDRRQIAEILAAFTRAHAPWPPAEAGQDKGNAPGDGTRSGQASATTRTTLLPRVAPLRMNQRAPDAEAAIIVLGRNPYFGRVAKPLPLQSLDLRGADLPDAQLEDVYLTGSNFELASLIGTNLKGALLSFSTFEKTAMYGADLREARLCEADLSTAVDLDDAKLEGAKADEKTRWPRDFNWKAAGVRVGDC